jgi:hypothetical protein
VTTGHERKERGRLGCEEEGVGTDGHSLEGDSRLFVNEIKGLAYVGQTLMSHNIQYVKYKQMLI